MRSGFGAGRSPASGRLFRDAGHVETRRIPAYRKDLAGALLIWLVLRGLCPLLGVM
jgi:hypothetical protein